jgi:CO/xanthine dehydrogenase FAD-binding subunit
MSVTVPTTLADALAALAAPGAVALAGGTDLMVEINAGLRRPSDVVALDRVPELKVWHHDEAAGTVRIGAGVTYVRLLSEPFASLVPALAEAARTVGSPQIRNAGTLGGNLATCSPAGDGLPVLAALDAQVELASTTGTRRLSVHELMVGVKRTALAPGELVVAVHLPVLAGWQGYSKVGVRNAMVIAIASACLVTDRPGRSVRLALGAVGPTIVRARATEAWLAERIDWEAGRVPEAVVDELGRRVAAEARPIDDHRSTAAYRRHAVAVMSRRLLRRAFP